MTKTPPTPRFSDLARLVTQDRRQNELPRAHQRILVAGKEVSPFCLGQVKDPQTIIRAYERGVNFFFLSCDLHWAGYQACFDGLRELLRRSPSVRDTICIATTSYVHNPDFVRGALSDLNKELPELGHLDLVVAGGLYEHDADVRIASMLQLKEEGVCKAVGASFHDRLACRRVLDEGILDIAYVRYNPTHLGALADLFPHRTDSWCPVFVFKATGGYFAAQQWDDMGLDPEAWRPQPADYYRFALSPQAVAGLLYSRTTPEEVDEAVNGAQTVLDEDELNHIVALVPIAIRNRARR
jgi:aryl-alcohol dehydrogenase-like predicted oxidoreductase